MEKAGKPSWPKVIGAVVGIVGGGLGFKLSGSSDAALIGTVIGAIAGGSLGWATELLVHLWQAPAHVAAQDFARLEGSYQKLLDENARIKKELAASIPASLSVHVEGFPQLCERWPREIKRWPSPGTTYELFPITITNQTDSTMLLDLRVFLSTEKDGTKNRVELRPYEPSEVRMLTVLPRSPIKTASTLLRQTDDSQRDYGYPVSKGHELVIENRAAPGTPRLTLSLPVFKHS